MNIYLNLYLSIIIIFLPFLYSYWSLQCIHNSSLGIYLRMSSTWLSLLLLSLSSMHFPLNDYLTLPYLNHHYTLFYQIFQNHLYLSFLNITLSNYHTFPLLHTPCIIQYQTHPTSHISILLSNLLYQTSSPFPISLLF